MEVGSPKLLFENLDLTPTHSILWTGLHQHGPGRPVEYNLEWDLKALMLHQIEQIPYIKDLAKRLRRDPYSERSADTAKEPPARPTSPRLRPVSEPRASESSRPGSGGRPSG